MGNLRKKGEISLKKQMLIKIVAWTAAAFVAAPLTVFGAQITQKKAESIALAHAGVNAADVVYTVTKMDWENGSSVYEVEFMTKDLEEYDYEIHTEDGTIFSMSCDAGNKVVHDRGSRGPGQKTPVIPLETAKSIALAHAGVKEEQAAFVKQQTDHDDGQIIYEIDFFVNETLKYEYDIDSATGEIEKWGFDTRSVRPANLTQNGTGNTAAKKTETTADTTAKSADNANHQTMRAAMNAALARAGLAENQVRWGKVELDHDDGRQTYEGKFFSGDLEYEFEYDIESGKIRDWDVESIYD